MKHWLRWSARHKWVSRSLARDEWIARTSDDQIVLNVTACKLALTTRAHDFLTANDGPNFLRAARALSLHVPPIQRVADVSERIEDLSDVPDAPRAEMRAIRDAARQKNEETPVTPCRLPSVHLPPAPSLLDSPTSWNAGQSPPTTKVCGFRLPRMGNLLLPPTGPQNFARQPPSSRPRPTSDPSTVDGLDSLAPAGLQRSPQPAAQRR